MILSVLPLISLIPTLSSAQTLNAGNGFVNLDADTVEQGVSQDSADQASGQTLNAGNGNGNLATDDILELDDGVECLVDDDYRRLSASAKAQANNCDDCDNKPATIWTSINQGALACGAEPAELRTEWLEDGVQCYEKPEGTSAWSITAQEEGGCKNCINGWSYWRDNQFRCGEDSPSCVRDGTRCAKNINSSKYPWCGLCCKGKVFKWFGARYCGKFLGRRRRLVVGEEN